MKTTFEAKVIFESDSLINDDPTTYGDNKSERFTLVTMRELINSKKVELVECILAYYTHDLTPVIYLKEKKKIKENG